MNLAEMKKQVARLEKFRELAKIILEATKEKQYSEECEALKNKLHRLILSADEKIINLAKLAIKEAKGE